MKYFVLLYTTFLFWNASAYADFKEDHAIAASILTHMQNARQSRQHLRAQTTVSYSKSDATFQSKYLTYQIPVILDATDTNCVIAKGKTALVNIDYVSKDANIFLDQVEAVKSQKKELGEKDAIGWVPGDLTPSDIYTLIKLGAPIPNRFSISQIQVSRPVHFPSKLQVTIPFEDGSTKKQEVVLIDPSEKTVLQADLYEIAPHPHKIWHLENQGFLRVHNSSHTLPAITKLDVSFLSRSGENNYRKVEINFQKAELLSAAPQMCQSFIFAKAKANEIKDPS